MQLFCNVRTVPLDRHIMHTGCNLGQAFKGPAHLGIGSWLTISAPADAQSNERQKSSRSQGSVDGVGKGSQPTASKVRQPKHVVRKGLKKVRLLESKTRGAGWMLTGCG